MATEGAPRVSVVVPVRDRRLLLMKLLDALDAQTFTDFEVIVVDDGSGDGGGSAAAQRHVAGRPVRAIPAAGIGAVPARRLGVANSSAAVLAFTDSDCAPSPGWLAAGVEAIESGADVVNGPTRPDRPPGPLERSVSSGEEGLYPTCNVFYRRSAYDAASGFDPHAGRELGFRVNRRARGLGFGEDTILAWRVRRSGGQAVFSPRAVVLHHVFEANLAESVSRCWMAAAFPALLREVPELRPTMLRHGVLFGARSRVPTYAVALALVLRRRRLGLLATAWWVWSRLQDLRRQPASWPRRLSALPQEMALDTVTAAALVAGSARARTLAL